MSLDFYARHDLPLAQELVSEHEKEFLPRLFDLLKTLDSELDNDTALRTCYALIASEEFILFYYYLSVHSPAASMFYFKTYLRAGITSTISRTYQRLISYLFPQNGPVLNSLTVNINEDKLREIFICFCEILLPVLKPEYNPEDVVKQFDIFSSYAVIRNNIKASDYLERNLFELDDLVEEYIYSRITLTEFIDKFTTLEIYANSAAKKLGYIAIQLSRSGNMDPKIAIVKEISRVNELIEIDNKSRTFLSNPTPDTAYNFLESYINRLSAEKNKWTNIKTALEFEKIEFDIKDELTEDNYNQILNSLCEAAQRFTDFPELLEFFYVLKTSPFERNYVVTDSTSESIKGFALITLITKATVEFVNLSNRAETYAPLINGMKMAMIKISELLLKITDDSVRLICVSKILNMLSRTPIHDDAFMEFSKTVLPNLVIDKHDLFQYIISDVKLHPYFIKWFGQES